MTPPARRSRPLARPGRSLAAALLWSGFAGWALATGTIVVPVVAVTLAILVLNTWHAAWLQRQLQLRDLTDATRPPHRRGPAVTIYARRTDRPEDL